MTRFYPSRTKGFVGRGAVEVPPDANAVTQNASGLIEFWLVSNFDHNGNLYRDLDTKCWSGARYKGCHLTGKRNPAWETAMKRLA